MPKFIVHSPIGYCFGVSKALEKTRETILNNRDKQIVLYRPLVHNKYTESKLLEYENVSIYKSDKAYDKDAIFIFSAHGMNEDDKAFLKNNNYINYIDTTCPFLEETKDKILSYLSEDKKVVFVGKTNHPETKFITSISKKIKFYDVKNLKEITFKEDEYVIPQSTISKNDFDILKEKIPNKDHLLTICRQCLYRWEQSLKVENSNSLCFLVCGDSSSSNSIEFYNLLVSKGYLTYFVQNEEEATKLKNELSKYETVHVVSATSFPKELVDSIVSILES